MPEIATGDTAPDFSLESTQGPVSVASILADGKRVVLAFYFEAGTPSCESEITMLRDSYETLRELNADVVAVSADSIETQRSFAERLGGMPFALACDADLAVARAYGVVDDGDPRRSRRAVFVIDTDGRVLLALPQFQPANVTQVEGIFAALGA